MKKFLIILFSIIGVVIIGFAMLIVSFRIGMKPDPEREAEIRAKAEDYLAENFNGNFEVFDILYDNMGNFGFEYAAKVRNVQSDTEFLVYPQNGTDEMVDTYISKRWAGDIEQAIRPYAIQQFGNRTELHVFIDDEIGRKLKIDPLKPGSYQDYSIAPTIRLTIPREKKKSDEKLFNDFIAYMKEEGMVSHGQLIVGYVAETGEILEDEEWNAEF